MLSVVRVFFYNLLVSLVALLITGCDLNTLIENNFSDDATTIKYSLEKVKNIEETSIFPIEFILVFSAEVDSTKIKSQIFYNKGTAKGLDISVESIGDAKSFKIKINSVQKIGSIDLGLTNPLGAETPVEVDNVESINVEPYERSLIPKPIEFDGTIGSADRTDTWMALGSPGSGTGGKVAILRLVDGSWIQFQIIDPPSVTNESFGYKVAVDGIWLMVSDNTDDETAIDAGAVYFYKFDGTSWVYNSKATPAVGAGIKFGHVMALSGEKSVIGIRDNNFEKAYFYHVLGGEWVEQQVIANPGDGFGNAVDIDGDFAIVAAPWDDNANGTNAGAGYIYKWDGVTWGLDQKLIAADYFAVSMGYCARISGSHIFMGPQNKGFDGSVGVIHEYDSVSWNEVQTLKFPSSYQSHNFYCGIEFDGNSIVLVDPGDSFDIEKKSSVYTFEKQNQQFVQTNQISEIQGTGSFTSDLLAPNGDTLLVLEGGLLNEIIFAKNTKIGPRVSAMPISIDEGTTTNLVIDIIGSFTQDIELHVFSEEQLAIHGVHFTAIDQYIVVSPGTTKIDIPITTIEENRASGLLHFYMNIETKDYGNVIAKKVLVQINNNDFPQAYQHSDPAGTDYFGRGLAASGNWLFAGASDNDDAGSNSGSAYFFEWNGLNWVQKQKMVPAGLGADDRFGMSMDINGDKAVASAFRDDDKGSNAGAVYSFIETAGVWTELNKIVASDGVAGDGFGSGITINGSRMFISAPGVSGSIGAVYYYTWDGLQWNEVEKISQPLPPSSSFGGTVDLDGDYLLVGNYGDFGVKGGVHMYHWSGSTWDLQSSFLEAGFGGFSDCGTSISIEYPWAAMGCYGDGDVFVYHHNGTEWTLHQTLGQESLYGGSTVNAYFGSGINIENGMLSVAAPGDKTPVGSSSIYIYKLSGNQWINDYNIVYPAPTSYVFPRVTFSLDQILMSDITYNGSRGQFYSFPKNP